MRQWIGLLIVVACVGGIALYPAEPGDEASRQAETVRIATVGTPLPVPRTPDQMSYRPGTEVSGGARIGGAKIVIVPAAQVLASVHPAPDQPETLPALARRGSLPDLLRHSLAAAPPVEAPPSATKPVAWSSNHVAGEKSRVVRQTSAPPQQRNTERPRPVQQAQQIPKRPQARSATVAVRPAKNNPPAFDARRLFAQLEASGR